MRPVAIYLACAAACAALPSAAWGCKVPAHAHVEARSPRAVVYAVYTTPRDEVSGDYGRRHYACLERVGKRILLARAWQNAYDQQSVTTFRLAGGYAAYAVRWMDHYGDAGTKVHVFDLRAEAVKWRAGGVATNSYHEPLVPDMVLAHDGSVAYTIRWSEYDNVNGQQPRRELRARDALGFRTLDSGLGIDVKSLTRDGRTIRWLSDGEERSAELR